MTIRTLYLKELICGSSIEQFSETGNIHSIYDQYESNNFDGLFEANR